MKEKDNKLDILRVMSMFLVIIIHLANYYCRAYDAISKSSYIGAIIFNALARVSVPIFFMISGALLLSKPYDSKKNKKRIIKMLITTVIFTVVYLLWDYFFMKKDIPNLLKLFTSPERSMLWFLYAIITLYIALPFTKCMVDNMDKRLDKLFIILWLIFIGLIYPLKVYFKLDIVYPIPIISGTYYLGYFVSGYLIYKYRDEINYKKYNLLNIILLIINLLIIILISLYMSYKRNTYYDVLLAYRSIFMMIISISTFILIYTNLHNKENKLISFVSKYSFGVYLIHGILLNLLMEKVIPYTKIISFIGIPLCFIILSVSSLIVVYILKKIPIIKDYL